jgi:hypothetical protein
VAGNSATLASFQNGFAEAVAAYVQVGGLLKGPTVRGPTHALPLGKMLHRLNVVALHMVAVDVMFARMDVGGRMITKAMYEFPGYVPCRWMSVL